MMRVARWFDTARVLRDARDSAAAHAAENRVLRHAVRERDRQLAELRRPVERLRAREPITVDTIKLAADLQQAEALLAQERELHRTTASVLRGYVALFGDVSQETPR